MALEVNFRAPDTLEACTQTTQMRQLKKKKGTWTRWRLVICKVQNYFCQIGVKM